MRPAELERSSPPATVRVVASTDPLPFRGFPPEAFDFYARLVLDNSKAFWTANREVYERAVREPFRALAAELEPEVGTFHMFRPHRDVRFSKDKSPYKTGQGMATEGEGGEVYYLHLDAEGLFAVTGYHQMARDQLAVPGGRRRRRERRGPGRDRRRVGGHLRDRRT